MLVGKDTDNKIKTTFAHLAKRRNPLPQGTCLEAHGDSRYGSPKARGCIVLKSANRPVICQACALQYHKFDEYLLSSNSSWTDNASDAKGVANEIAFSDDDGDEGHNTHTPACLTTLFNHNMIPVSC
jgi:hypothetical protein